MMIYSEQQSSSGGTQMITAMSESGSDGDRVMPGRKGRPAMSSDQKKRQKSFYVSPDNIEFLTEIDPNLSAALEALIEEKKSQLRKKKKTSK
jgi:hypothetical protein